MPFFQEPRVLFSLSIIQIQIKVESNHICRLLAMQAPLDFVLKGVLQSEDGEEEEIGLELIDGYAVCVYKPQCLGR